MMRVGTVFRAWARSRVAVFGGIGLLVGVVGFGIWRYYQNDLAEKASLHYTQLLEAADRGETDRVRAEATLILDTFPGTVYAPFSAFFLAEAALQTDPSQARAALNRVLDRISDPALRTLCMVRLARLLAEDGQGAAALLLLDKIPPSALLVQDTMPPSATLWKAVVSEIRGDIYFQQRDLRAAQEAYDAAAVALAQTGPEEARLLPFLAFKQRQLEGVSHTMDSEIEGKLHG